MVIAFAFVAGLVLLGVVTLKLGAWRNVRLSTPLSDRAHEVDGTAPKAMHVPSSSVQAFAIIMVALAFWGVHRFLLTEASMSQGSESFSTFMLWSFNAFFVAIVLQLTLAFSERTVHDHGLTLPRIAVLVPVHNEDPRTLHLVFAALLEQTHLPDEIHVVDDGSDDPEAYLLERQWFEDSARHLGVRVSWTRTENRGKRRAQVEAFRHIQDANILVTVDSDSILDKRAIHGIAQPFHNGRIQAVAGVVLAYNNHRNLLSRVTDLLFVTQQLTDRSAMSRLGSVLVNSGGLAAYRVSVLRNNVDTYLNERYLGRSVEFSDDSMLTLFALKRGKVVQQPSAFAFCVMPETLSHHYRQQARWMRGSFIRGLWRIKFLPVLSWGFWRQLLGWVQLFLATALVLYLVVWLPIVEHRLPPLAAIIVPICLSYAQATRYLGIWRSDTTARERWITFAMAPFMALWQNIFIRPIRFWGILTSRSMGWNTRQQVEVDLSSRATQPV